MFNSGPWGAISRGLVLCLNIALALLSAGSLVGQVPWPEAEAHAERTDLRCSLTPQVCLEAGERPSWERYASVSRLAWA